MHKRPSMFMNAASSWAGIGINVITSFLLTPYIISHLGKEGYGIWVLALSVIGYYGFLDLGLHSATIRYIARYVGKRDKLALYGTISTSLILFMGIGCLVICLSFLIAGPLSRFLRVSDIHAASFERLIWLVGIAAGIGFPRRVLGAILMANEQFVLCNALGAVILIGRTITLFIVLSLGGGLEAIGWVELCTETVSLVGTLIACLVRTEDFKFSPSRFNRKTAVALFSFASLTFVALLGDTLRWNIDSLVIGRFLNLEAVAVYGIASVLVRLFMRVSSSVAVVTFPRLSSLAGVNPEAFQENYLRYSQITALVVTGVALELCLLSPGFIALWVGPTFREAIPVAVILTGAISLDYITSVSVNAMKAVNRQKPFAIQTVAEGAVNLGLSILLVGPFGLIGVALGTAIPMAITKLLIQPVYSCRILRVGLYTYCMRTIVQPLALGSAIGLIFYLAGFTSSNDSFLTLSMKGVAVACAYVLAVSVLIREVEKEFSLRLRAVNLIKSVVGFRN